MGSLDKFKLSICDLSLDLIRVSLNKIHFSHVKSNLLFMLKFKKEKRKNAVLENNIILQVFYISHQTKLKLQMLEQIVEMRIQKKQQLPNCI
jgi:hypothetical protein